ncbi:MAG: T9SS type A sorting domain-containing protein [Bacteroidetes bacterium]|nr:T9SS type A sorting domain-containing protein [Bacteroidota bacterium]
MNFGNSGGISTVVGTGSLSILSTFTGILTLKNFQYSSSDSVSIIMNNASSKLILNSGVYFERPFSFYGRNIQLNGASFDSSVTITRYGTTGDVCSGGNTFGWNTIIKDSSSTAHNFILANSFGDKFDGNVTFIQKGSGVNIYPAYSESTFFSGDVVVESTSGMQFGANGGFSKFKAGSIQTIQRNGSGTIQFKKLEVDKKGNYVELATPITVTDSLNLFKYYLHSDSINLLTLSDNIKVTGGSDSSYIMGFVSKIGNDSFLFPLGSPELTHPYHPLGISAPANTTDAFLSVLIPAQQNYGNEMDSTIENISACDYWKLYRTNGSSAVKVNLSWNDDDCILTKPTEMRVAGWNGTRWKDLGNSHSSGDSIIGNVTSLNTITQFGAFALSNNVCVTFETYPSTKNVSCYNYKNGYAKVIAQGGTPPYYYSWSDSLGFAYEISNLAPDTFIVNTTDVHGCLLTDTVHIYQPDSITVTFSTTSSVCKDSTGIAIVTPSGGTPPYNYLWSLSGNEDSTETNLKAGNYFVIVGDTNGCFKTYEAIVADTNGPVSTISVLSHVSCHGYRDGSAQISISSGKAPFHFEWLNSSDTDSVAVRLPAGTQSVKITDNDGCLSLKNLTITQPTELSVSLSITPSGCGQSNGEVTPTVSGGISPYAYRWIVSGSNEAEKKSVPQGIDTLIVEDLNKCRVKTTAIISNSNGPTVSSTILSAIPCYDDTSGSILVTATGGTLPYSYNWFPSVSTTDTANNLWSGTYTVIVKDSNNCYGVSTITLDQPAPLQVNIYATNASSDSTNDGNAGSIILGGTLPFSYQWIPSGDSTPIALNLYAGIDTLIVTDAKGCIDSSFFEISSTGCQNFHCDPYIDFSTIQTCSGGNNGNFTVIKDLHADFGANGDPESDRCAFEEAMNFFRNNLKPDRYNANGPPRPGNGILTIPAGTFYVGYQYTPDVPCQWYLKGHDIMCMDGWQDFTIKGGNLDYAGQQPVTKIKYVDCLKFGAFDPITGDRWLSSYNNCGLRTHLPLWDETGACWQGRLVNCVVGGAAWHRVAAYIGECIAMVNCNNMKIENLELDGNSDNIIYGGHYTDGIQLPHDGIFIDHSIGVIIKNVNAHHFGRDGLMIADNVCNFNPPPIGDNLNIRIGRSKFNWNGRNGFSLVGGHGIIVNNSEFNHNAVGRLASMPGVGVDIEWENGNSQIRSTNSGTDPAIEFNGCRFHFNKNAGIENESDQTYEVLAYPYQTTQPNPPSRLDLFEKRFNFNYCTFVGSENGYAAIPNGKAFTFTTCHFYGQVLKSYFSPMIIDLNGDEQTKFINCTFNEIYNGKSMNHQTVNECSTPVCGNTQGCVDARDQGLIHISYGARTLFEGCTFNSNYSMRWGLFSGHHDRGPGPWPDTMYSYDKLELSACFFNNDGMNTQLCGSTSCYTSLGEFINTKITFGTQFRILNGTVNTPTNCPQYTYYRIDYHQLTCEPNNAVPPLDQNHIFIPAVCVPKYFDCRVNPVQIDIDCQDCDVNCIACNILEYEETCPNPNPSQRNASKSDQKLGELKISPNPSTNLIHVEGAENEKLIQILNVYGACVKQELYLNSQQDIHIESLAPGIYFIRIENKLISKFIKLE